MRVLISLFLGIVASFGSSAIASPGDLSPGLSPSALIDMSPPKIDKPSFFNWQIGGPLGRAFERHDNMALGPNTATQLVSATRFVPITLQIAALSGHRGFATQSLRERTRNRMTVDISNTILGVGTTVSFDAAVSEHFYASPFVSLDYNRVDSARVVNARSPIPFARNNGDTGLTGSAGATFSFVSGPRDALRLTGYGAVTAGSHRQVYEDKGATVATRVVQALSEPAIDAVSVELGVGTSYVLTEAMRFDTAMVRTSLADGRTAVSGQVVFDVLF